MPTTRRHIQRSGISLLLAMLVALASAAGRVDAQIVAFSADFDQDTVGQEPDLDPPGEPSGDSMSLNTAGGNITVETSYGVMMGKPLVMDRLTTGAFTVQGILDPTLTSCGGYTVTWTAMITEATDNVAINFRSTTNATMAQFGYQPEGVLAYNGFQNPLVTGYSPNVPQDFEVTIDLVNDRTSLSIDGNPEPNAQNLPFVSPNFSGTFGSFLVGFAGLENEEFVMDDIEIVGIECGDVPTRQTTWAALKSRYR